MRPDTVNQAGPWSRVYERRLLDMDADGLPDLVRAGSTGLEIQFNRATPTRRRPRA